MQVGEGQQVQIVQAQPQGQAHQAQSGTRQTMQVMQTIITNTGEIQQIAVLLNAGQLQYIRLAKTVSSTQVVQGQIRALATNAQQITQTEVQQGQQQFSQFTDGQVGTQPELGSRDGRQCGFGYSFLPGSGRNIVIQVVLLYVYRLWEPETNKQNPKCYIAQITILQVVT